MGEVSKQSAEVPSRLAWLTCAAVACVALLAWWPSLNAGWFWDDRGTFLTNPWLGADLGSFWTGTFWAESLRAHLGHWQPLSWWSLRLDLALWGGLFDVAAPRAHLLGNVLLHAASAAALCWLLLDVLRLQNSPRQRGRQQAPPQQDGQPRTTPRSHAVAAAVVALAWALHPARVESVSWATERRDVLATLWALLGLILWLRGRANLSGAASEARDGPWSTRWWWVAAAACFTLSALAKAWVVALPGALFALEISLFGLRDVRRAAARSAAWLVLAAPVAGVAAWAQHQAGATSGAGLSLLERVVGAGHHLLVYLNVTLLPLALSPLHPMIPGRTLNAAHMAGFIGALGLTGLLLWRAVKRPSPAAAAALGAWVGFAAWLAPVLGLLQSGVQATAERYLILAQVPLAIYAVVPLAAWLRQRRVALTGLAMLVVLAWSARMWTWQHVWIAGPEALWTAAIEAEPRSVHARVNRAALRLARGAAVGDDLRIALALAPHDATGWKVQAEVLRRAGRPDAALGALRRAARYAPSDSEVQCNLGALLASRGQRAKAKGLLDAAIDAGGGPECHLNRAVLRVQSGDRPGAAADVRAALARLPPGHPQRQRAEGMARALGSHPANARPQSQRPR